MRPEHFDIRFSKYLNILFFYKRTVGKYTILILYFEIELKIQEILFLQYIEFEIDFFIKIQEILYYFEFFNTYISIPLVEYLDKTIKCLEMGANIISKWWGLSKKKKTPIIFSKCIYDPSFKQNYFSQD